MSDTKEQKIVKITPGLYRILPEDPLDITKGPGGIIKPIAPNPAVYATAPVNNPNPITLESQKGGNERQIWQVKIVDEAKGIYNINRADGVWLPPEHPPTFGIDGPPADRKAISCLDGAKDNPHKWNIRHVPPRDPWLQQNMFAIIPVPDGGGEPKYFADDGTALLAEEGESAQAQGGGSSLSQGMILRTLGQAETHVWYFEPVFHTQAGQPTGGAC